MATAYVLVNCELGSEESIIQQLKNIETVKEVNGTFGDAKYMGDDLLMSDDCLMVTGF